MSSFRVSRRVYKGHIKGTSAVYIFRSTSLHPRVNLFIETLNPEP